MNPFSSRLDATLLHTILEGCQFVFTLSVAIRAFFLYRKTQNERLFLLGFALLLFSSTAIVSLVGDNALLTFPLNTNWLKYAGQTVSLFFIWLSGFEGSVRYLRLLKSWLVFCSFLLLVLLSITYLLPPFPNPWVQALLSTLRGVACLLIFFQYLQFFLEKATRFTVLMGITFLLLSFSYYLIFPKFLLPHQDFLATIGDLTRIVGFLLFGIATFLG